MPRVSRIPVEKDVHRQLVDFFTSLVAELDNEEEIKIFLTDFLTPEEKLMLSKRLFLMWMLKRGFSSSDIRDILKVSKTTINSMKHQLAYKRGVEVGLQKLAEMENAREFEEKLNAVLKHVPPLTWRGKARARWLNR